GVLLAIGAIAVALTPETATPPDPRPPHRPQRVAVPSAACGRFFGAAAAAFVSFAAFGLFTSLAPSFLAGTLGHASHALAGVPAFPASPAAAVAQLAAGRGEVRRLLGLGMTVLAAGLALLVAAPWRASLAGFLAAGLIAGAGAGLLFMGGIAIASGLTVSER